jgi:hypothetical protein
MSEQEKPMPKQTKSEVPEWVDPMKVLEWTFESIEKEGVISTHQVFEEASKLKYNWLLFYCWCYVRTSGFTTQGMKHWDYGNFGGKFKTSRDGVKDALSEFIKYPDTGMMNEGRAVEILYDRIEAFCRGVVWTEPKPLPKPPEPPQPKPQPPAPKPDEPAPSEPGTPQKPPSSGGFNWKIIVPIAIAVLTVGSMFVPGWAKIAIDILIKLLNGL